MPLPNESLLSYSAARWRYYSYSTGTWSAWSSLGNELTLSRQRVTVSVQTPDFFAKKRRLLPINNYSKDVTVASDPITTWVVDSRSYPTDVPASHSQNVYEANTQWITGLILDYVDIVGDLTQQVTAKLLDQLSEGKTNTMVTAAELHKTASHVAKTATRLYGALRALKHGDFGGFTTSLGITSTRWERKRFNKRYSKAKSQTAQEHKYSERSYNTETQDSRMSSFMSETWLEYTYGWKPLIRDVYDHAKALAELHIDRQNVVRYVKARHKLARVEKSTFVSSYNPVQVSLRRESTKWLEIGVGYRLLGGELNAFTQLGIGNPLEVAWELVPFSFVADWFLPVGNFLKSLTATQGLVFVNGYKSHRMSHKYEITYSGDGGSHVYGTRQYTTESGSGMASREDFEFHRSLLTDFPSPSFPSVRDPRDSNTHGVYQALSAISLLQSLFLKQKSTRSEYL